MLRKVVNRDTSEYSTWLAAILLFLLVHPYFVWSYVQYFNWIVTLPLLVLFLLNFNNNKLGVVPFLAIALFSLAAYCSGQSFAGFIFLLSDVLVLFVRQKFLSGSYEKFRKIFIIALSLSIAFYLLYLLGFPLPSHQIKPLNELKLDNYIAYPFFILSMADTGRFCGMFDEPGVVGTFAFIFLFIEKFNFKKRGNLIIALGGLLSLSVFFYIAFVVFFLIFRSTLGKSKTKIISLIIAGIAAFALLQLPVINERIVERIQWDQESNTLSGDDRASIGLVLYIESIRGSSQYYWGQRFGGVIDDYKNSASIFNAVLIYGVVVVVLYFAFFAFFSIRQMGFGLRVALYLLFLAMVLYNRPSLFPLLYFYLYTVSLYSVEGFTKSEGDTK